MFCQNCGKELNNSEAYCSRCGTKAGESRKGSRINFDYRRILQGLEGIGKSADRLGGSKLTFFLISCC